MFLIFFTHNKLSADAKFDAFCPFSYSGTFILFESRIFIEIQ